MTRKCVVGGCSNTTADGCKLHHWPKNKQVASIWEKFVRSTKSNWTASTKWAEVCSVHFAEDAYETSELRRSIGYVAKLKKNAVPTIQVKKKSEKENAQNDHTRFAFERRDNLRRAELSSTDVSHSSDIQTPPIPVHLYKVQTESDQTLAESARVIIKAEPEGKENETTGLSVSLYKANPSSTSEATQSSLGNETHAVLLSDIKTEPVDYEITTPVNSSVNKTETVQPREVTLLNIQSVESGAITLSTGNHQQVQPPKTGSVTPQSVLLQSRTRTPADQFNSRNSSFVGNLLVNKVDVAVQTSPDVTHASTDTRDCSETDIDPSQLVIVDMAQVVVLHPSQLSGFNPAKTPGFNPATIPGFNPSRIPGYDPTQEYRAVYVKWKEKFDGKTGEAMDEGLPESSELTADDQSEAGRVQEGMCASDRLSQTINDIIRFTEVIQNAKENVELALQILKNSMCSCRKKMTSFVSTLQNLLDLANNNVLHMIKQLAASTKQQQTQILHLAELVGQLKREQVDMEKQLLKSRKIYSKTNQTPAYKPELMISTKEEHCVDFVVTRKQNEEATQDLKLKEKNSLRCYTKRKQNFAIDKRSPGNLAISKRRKLCVLRSQHDQKKHLRNDTARFLKELRQFKRKSVTLSFIQKNPDLCEKYTGFSNYVQLKDVFNKILRDPNFSGSGKYSGKSSVRKLSLENEFLMTLVKIKMMVPVCYLCSQYKVSRSVVRETVAKWTGVLFRTLNGLTDEPGYSSMKPLLTITKRALTTIQNNGSYKSRRPRNSLICP